MDDNTAIISTDIGIYVYNIEDSFHKPKSMLLFMDNFPLSSVTIDKNSKIMFILSQHGELKNFLLVPNSPSIQIVLNHCPEIKCLIFSFSTTSVHCS